MAEYIEREALYEKAYWHGERPDVGNPYAEGVEAVDIRDVDSIPAADVVEVVRCKDCKHNGTPECPMVFEEWVKWDDDGYAEWELVTCDKAQDDGFCDRGERRDTDG